MTKKFGGFTDQQKEVLARKMGFNGPMNQFTTFLQSSPANATKFQAYETKAKQVVESAKAKRGFAEGGTVTGEQATQTLYSNPTTEVTKAEVSKVPTNDSQLISSTSGQAANLGNVQAATVQSTAQAAEATPTAAPTVTTTTSAEKVADAAADMKAVQGTVSQNAQVVAAEATPTEKATVQGQLATLMKQFEGGEAPAWAAGAMRNANAVMAQRGLGASSMAGSAVTQAAMESALQIAVADASTYSAFEMQNLTNRQQARLANAQAFLQMDLANLDAANQTELVKSQSIIQSLFTDAAAENATKQFNASSQSQTEQFFASLKTQVQQFNATQTNAMSQFNADAENATAQFNSQMDNQREQFNATNRLVIDQSNAEWRRQTTLTDTAATNAANMQAAQDATQMTLAAYNNMMQKERDLYTFAFQTAENTKQRAHEVALAKLSEDGEASSALGAAVGGFAATVLSNW